MGQFSGLAPTWQGGPVDRCVIDGTWNPQQHLLHGWPIPMMSGAPGSRGVPESWPHTNSQWAEKGLSTQGINLGQTILFRSA